MKHLYLLRHAKSAWPSDNPPDHDRPLAERGRQAAPLIGQYLAQKGPVPDRVLCSTATRAHQTLALVMAQWLQPPEIVYERRLYDAEGPDLIAIASEQPRRAEAVMLVGHNPAIADAARTLGTSHGDPDALAAMDKKVPTAALAKLACSISDWSGLAADRCRLADFVTPKMLG